MKGKTGTQCVDFVIAKCNQQTRKKKDAQEKLKSKITQNKGLVCSYNNMTPLVICHVHVPHGCDNNDLLQGLPHATEEDENPTEQP